MVVIFDFNMHNHKNKLVDCICTTFNTYVEIKVGYWYIGISR